MKEQIDIEALLEWAYRTQCVDRRQRKAEAQRPAVLPQGSPFASIMALGTRVDTSGFQPIMGYGLIEGSGPDDADLVHDAVLALPDCWLEWRTADEVVLHDEEPSCTSQFVSAAVLVVLHGRQGLRPDVHEGVVMRAGRPPSAGDTDARGRRRKSAELMQEFQAAMHARALYMVWRRGLVILADQLKGRLTKFDVLPPQAPEAPWEGKLKVVHRAVPNQNDLADKPMKLKADV